MATGKRKTAIREYERQFGKVCVQVYKCLHNMAPGYLSSLCQPVSSVPGRRHLRSWSWWTGFPPVSICPRTGDGRLPTQVLHPGTGCLTISRTLIFRFKLSNVTVIHSSFYTSTFSAFEVSYKNTLYKFTVLLLLLLFHCADGGKMAQRQTMRLLTLAVNQFILISYWRSNAKDTDLLPPRLSIQWSSNVFS